MFITSIDMWVSRYLTEGVGDVATIQERLLEDLREHVPVNLVNASINRVREIRNGNHNL